MVVVVVVVGCLSSMSISKPNETSLRSISPDLLRKTTGGVGFDCRLSRDESDDDDECDDKRGEFSGLSVVSI